MGKAPKFFATDQFKRLQRKWYKKLEKSGFQDHEKLVGSSLVLSQSAGFALRHEPTLLTAEAKLEYYLKLSEMVAKESFENNRDRVIMECAGQGLKICAIAKELKKRKIKCHRLTIGFVIRRYEHKWKIRSWSLKQMNLATAS